MRVWLYPCVLAWLVPASAFGQPVVLPEPPQHRTPWRPPENLPTDFLSAARTLFEQGFPDPRSCEYRDIEVEVSGVWDGKSSLARTRGWVLPAKAPKAQRFAICWNGLIYPVARLGAAADVHSEARILHASAAWRFDLAAGETRTVFSTNALSTRVLLLLRCGEIEAALTNWIPDARQGDRRSDAWNAKPDDPYLSFASDWAWALFDRTICAHMRGDEALALATAQKLAEVRPKIEAEAARRGFRRQPYFGPSRQGKENPYLDFLEQLPQLLADLERRAREAKRVSFVESSLQRIPNQPERIAALIRDLDLVSARQWGQPGAVNLAEDPVVSALIQQGDAAVEPLMNCLETDKRLTRSVGFGRDFHRGRSVVPVTAAARVAVQTILHANFQSVSEMRAYWKKYGGLRLEDRWYAILRDDSAGMGRWLEAAAIITQPTNATTFPGTGFSVERPVPTNAPVRMHGESLRGNSAPSVSELLTRRAVELLPANPGSYDLSSACQIGLRLAAWDAHASIPVTKTLVERCLAVTVYSEPRRNSWPEQRLGTLIAKLTVARAQAGDGTAFEDYAVWLKATVPEQSRHYLAESLEPLRKFPTNEVLQVAADRLFNDPNSMWSKLPRMETGLFRPIESELVNVPAFRRLLSRELDDQAMCGTVEWRTPNMATFQITNALRLNATHALALPEKDRPANGTKSELRWCDWIASSLSKARQIPLFNPFTPVEARDESIKDAKALLER